MLCVCVCVCACVCVCVCVGECSLKVLRWSGVESAQLLEVREVTSVWKRFDINITSAEEYQVRRLSLLLSFLLSP